MRNPAKKQAGYLLMALTAALSVVAFGFLVAYSTLLSKKESAELATQQAQYVAAVGRAITTVYRANAGSIDGDESQGAWRNASAYLQAAGVSSRWGLQVAVSDRIENQDVDYTVIAVWLPTNADATNPASFDTSTGQFTPCVQAGVQCNRVYAVVSGLTLERTLRQKAIEQLNNVAVAAQSFFKARYLEDPDHNVTTNYFRAPSGCGVSGNEIPCLDAYTPVSATNVQGLLGLSGQSVTNPWGYQVLATNAAGQVSTTTPYTMGFSSQPPWSRITYTTFAVQPY